MSKQVNLSCLHGCCPSVAWGPECHRNSFCRFSCGRRSCAKEELRYYGCFFCKTGTETSIAGYIIQPAARPLQGRRSRIGCSRFPDTSSFELKLLNGIISYVFKLLKHDDPLGNNN